MKKLFKRSLAVALALIMCVSMLNLTAFAKGPGDTQNECHHTTGSDSTLMLGTWHGELGYMYCYVCHKDIKCPEHKDNNTSTSGERVEHDHECDYCHLPLTETAEWGKKEVKRTAATCTEPGHIYYACSYSGGKPCNRFTEDVTGDPALGHTWENEGQQTSGYVDACNTHNDANCSGHYLVCDRDGCAAHSPIEAHRYGAGVKQASGKMKYTCRDCGHWYETDCTHTSVTRHGEVAANCIATGTAEYWECNDCHTLFSDAALMTVIAAPVTIDALGHQWPTTWTDDDAAGGACAHTGMTHSKVCTRCHGDLTGGTDSENHTYGNWTLSDWADIPDADGIVRYQYRTATRSCACGHSETATYDNPLTYTGEELRMPKGTFSVTVNYVDKDDHEHTLAESTGATGLYATQTYNAAPAVVEGWSTEGVAQTVTIVDRNVVITYEYTRNNYDVTVQYEGLPDDLKPEDDVTEDVPYGDPIDDPVVPVIPGYTSTVSEYPETMPDEDVTITVTYTAIPYTVVINYLNSTVNAAGGHDVLSPAVTISNLTVEDGDYTQASPTIDGYRLTVAAQATVSGVITANTIPAEGTRIVIDVYYTALGNRTVRWVNWDGTSVLQAGSFREDQTAPASSAYSNATPTRASDGTYTYTFSGWSAPAVDANGNVTYTAQFTPTLIYYPPVVTPTPSPEPSEEVEVTEPPTPLDPTPELPDEPIEVDEPDTPLVDLPELPEEPVEVEVEDPDVPLANVPQTGDNTVLWATTAVVSGAGLIWLAVDGKKRREDAE